jgi:chemotaxis protein CheX
MDLKYVDSFLTAVVTTFDTMLGCKLDPQEAFIKRDLQPEHEVNGIIGLSSAKAKGSVVLSLSHEAALSATGAMLGQRPADVNGDVIDAVGELTNIIAGVAKAKLEHLALNVSLPTTIVGKQHLMGFPHKAVPVCIPYGCPWGNVALEVALIEATESAEQGNGKAEGKPATPILDSPAFAGIVGIIGHVGAG